MRERPLQRAMNDKVGVAADGRSEMRVLVEAQREVAERIRGVASLFEGTQHEVRDDALLGLAGKFANEALVVLRCDAQILLGAGKSDAHAALATFAGGVRPSSACGGRDAAVAHGDFALMQTFDSQRIAEGARELLKFQNFFGVGFLVDAMKRFDAALKQVSSDSAIGSKHELFDEAMRDIALAASDVDHFLLLVEFDDALREIEIDGAVFVATGVEQECEFLHVAEVMRKGGVGRG